MNYYYFDRGLSVVEDLAKRFSARHWVLPNFICDEVLDTIFKYVDDYSYYNVKDDFSWEVQHTGFEPKVLYAITYFGKELYLGQNPPPNVIVIRDSVWMPHPFAPVDYNQIWFNSLRKIIRGAKGASVATHFRLEGLNEVPNLFNHPSMTWKEINHRNSTFIALQELIPPENAISYIPQFATVFPIRLKDRDEVLKQIEQPLPGMWKNKYKIAHPLYKELTFIPVDSRFDRNHVLKLAEKMVELDGS